MAPQHRLHDRGRIPDKVPAQFLISPKAFEAEEEIPRFRTSPARSASIRSTSRAARSPTTSTATAVSISSSPRPTHEDSCVSTGTRRTEHSSIAPSRQD
jgi:hypothetical protein